MPEASDDCLWNKLSLCDCLKVMPCLLFSCLICVKHPSSQSFLWGLRVSQFCAQYPTGNCWRNWRSCQWWSISPQTSWIGTPLSSGIYQISDGQISAGQKMSGQIIAGQIFGVIKYSWKGTPRSSGLKRAVDGHSDLGVDVNIDRDDVCFFISQSGETADTLGALR